MDAKFYLKDRIMIGLALPATHCIYDLIENVYLDTVNVTFNPEKTSPSDIKI